MDNCPVCGDSLEFVGEMSGGYQFGGYHYECSRCKTTISPGRDSWVRCCRCAEWCKAQFRDNPHKKLLHKIPELREQGLSSQEIANELNWEHIRTQKNRPWSRTSLAKIIYRSPANRPAIAAKASTVCDSCRRKPERERLDEQR